MLLTWSWCTSVRDCFNRVSYSTCSVLQLYFSSVLQLYTSALYFTSTLQLYFSSTLQLYFSSKLQLYFSSVLQLYTSALYFSSLLQLYTSALLHLYISALYFNQHVLWFFQLQTFPSVTHLSICIEEIPTSNTFLCHRGIVTVVVAAAAASVVVVKQGDNYIWERIPANFHVYEHREPWRVGHPVHWPEIKVYFVGKTGRQKVGGGDRNDNEDPCWRSGKEVAVRPVHTILMTWGFLKTRGLFVPNRLGTLAKSLCAVGGSNKWRSDACQARDVIQMEHYMKLDVFWPCIIV